MVPPVHDLPLGPPHEPINEIKRRRVSDGYVIAPEVARDVEAGVEGDEERGGKGRVAGEAVVLLHPVAEDDVNGELIGSVPAGVREDALNVFQGGAEAGVGGELAHVGPKRKRSALLQHVLVEAGGEVVDVDVAPSTAVGLVEGGLEGACEGKGGWRRGFD